MNITVENIPGATIAPGNELFIKRFFLTAGETDAHGLMPLRLMAMRAIETATDHSNLLGIGYADLALHGIGWVLARMTIDVKDTVAINQPYEVATWIESSNRFFSTRAHQICAPGGRIVADLRTVWAAIDTTSRSRASLEVLDQSRFIPCSRKVDIKRMPAPSLHSDCGTSVKEHRFEYSDIDFNRHVNAVSYIVAAVNLHDLDFYDRHRIKRLDISYDHECYFGENVSIISAKEPGLENSEIIELRRSDNLRLATLRLLFY